MKKLMIMRHAKSDWDNPEIADFDRPLNSRGLKAAPFMGSVIYKNCVIPDLVISSPAKRAKQTAVLVKESAGIEGKIQYDERIYEASQTTLLYLASTLNDNYNSILLVGHNPGIEGLIRLLSGETLSMPTGAIAKIACNIESWSQLASNCGEIELVMRPKDLMQRVDL